MILRDGGNQSVGVVLEAFESVHKAKGYFEAALLRSLRRHWTFLVALLPLLGWWTYGLFDLDEGFYAAIAAEMNRRGEWITPFYNGKPWFEKPILIYWLLKPSIALFGDMVGPRLPSILATVGLYALCSWFAKRHLPQRSAKWVPLVLGSSLVVVGPGRMALTDPLLDLAMAGALLTFWESLVGDRRWRIVAAACLGFGVLAKGPVAGLLFLPIAGWTYWKQPDLRPAFRGGWLAGIAVFALIVASWYVPCYLQNGHIFVQDFLIDQNLKRFTGGDIAHTVPLYYGWTFYFLILLVGFAPWWFYIRPAWRQESSVIAYLKTWAAFIFLFFTISGAKLPHYVLPAVPPLALLVAGYLAERKEPKRYLGWVVGAAFVANAGFAVYYYGLPAAKVKGFHAEVHQLARYVHEHAAPSDGVAVYSLPRVKGLSNKPGTRIQETSHPSLLLYLDRDVIDTKDWSKLLNEKVPVWIITRWNRVQDAERKAAGGRLHEVDPFPPDLYRLYKLDPAPTQVAF
jgi:4-amino-4-deoxy-L-arabinose transferase-like glycosyltransferase